MKAIVACGLVLGLALGSAVPASGSLYYGFQIGITNAPPPPVVRTVREPHVVLATDAMVYVVEDAGFRGDDDTFRYGQYWFIFTHGYWYRARSFRGPYAVIEVRSVPRAILGVPRARWKHHPLGGPPGQLKKARANEVAARSFTPAGEKEPDRSRGRGHGR